MQLNSLFWKNKKVLLTGHTGFIGSWLVLFLNQLGAEVVGYALEPRTRPNLFSLLALSDLSKSNIGNICDLENLHKVCCTEKPDIFIHLAAQPIVRQSYLDPVETYYTNVMGTVNILECFKRADRARVLINVTTDKCYENKEWLWGYRENESLGGRDPYSSSKACSELITNAYRNSFFSNDDVNSQKAIATARAGNIIGGGDWSEDRLIPDFIRSLALKESLEIRNPYATRPWQYVLDAISGYLKLAEELWVQPKKFSGAWNFGPKDVDCKSVEYIINSLCSKAPHKIKWKKDVKKNPHEAHFLKLDSSKAREYLNWETQTNIDQALNLTIEWYLAYFHSDNLNKRCENEINKFTQLKNTIFIDKIVS